VEVSFLHPHGPAQSFRYPTVPDILVMNLKDILTVMEPTTVTGRAYILTQDEQESVAYELQTRKMN
jgi:hypothetical protein